MVLTLVLSAAALLTVAHTAKVKPASSYFDICHTSQADFNECALRSINKALPALRKGIPEIGVQPVEPMFVPLIKMEEDSGSLKLSLALTNITIHGLSDFKMDFKYNKDEDSILFILNNPKIKFVGDYSMDGKILLLPVKGSGEVTYNFNDVTTTIDSKFEDYEKNGKIYYRIKNLDIKIEPKNGSSYYTNLFNGDKALGEATNKALNDNWKEVYDATRQLPEQAFSKLLKAMSNQVYSHFPKEELFPN